MTTSTKVSVYDGVTRIEASCTIAAPRHAGWHVLAVPGRIAEWHPMIKQSESCGAAVSGNNAERICSLRPMGSMHEKISEWQDGYSYRSSVVGGRLLPPVQFMHGTVALQDSGQHTCVRFVLRYKMKYGRIGRAMDASLIRQLFKQSPRAYVEGLRDFVLTAPV